MSGKTEEKRFETKSCQVKAHYYTPQRNRVEPAFLPVEIAVVRPEEFSHSAHPLGLWQRCVVIRSRCWSWRWHIWQGRRPHTIIQWCDYWHYDSLYYQVMKSPKRLCTFFLTCLQLAIEARNKIILIKEWRLCSHMSVYQCNTVLIKSSITVPDSDIAWCQQCFNNMKYWIQESKMCHSALLPKLPSGHLWYCSDTELTFCNIISKDVFLCWNANEVNYEY